MKENNNNISKYFKDPDNAEDKRKYMYISFTYYDDIRDEFTSKIIQKYFSNYDKKVLDLSRRFFDIPEDNENIIHEWYKEFKQLQVYIHLITGLYKDDKCIEKELKYDDEEYNVKVLEDYNYKIMKKSADAFKGVLNSLGPTEYEDTLESKIEYINNTIKKFKEYESKTKSYNPFKQKPSDLKVFKGIVDKAIKEFKTIDISNESLTTIMKVDKICKEISSINNFLLRETLLTL